MSVQTSDGIFLKRKVNVSRTPTHPSSILKTTGRLIITGDQDFFLDSIFPGRWLGSIQETDIYYFKARKEALLNEGPHFTITAVSLEEEYRFNGLVPNAIVQIIDNVANPSFADEVPNTCMWRMATGCYHTTFYVRTWGDDVGKRCVYVNEFDIGYSAEECFFAGVRAEH